MIIVAHVLLILLGATEILQADLLPDEKISLLPPVNFTIKVTGLAQVLLQWKPNPDQEQRNVNLEYQVKINAPKEDDYETRITESKCVTILHKGFSASVRTILQNDHSLLASSWASAELHAPPGNDEHKPLREWFVIVIMATICFILLILSLICKICHLWIKLFPPIPAPKSNIKDLFVTTNYEKAGSSETEIEVICYIEKPGVETLEDSVF
uniref:Isoform 5 of Interleukin-5 receptor subunit alpha n=1 Tax=Homo sapiens TaxID=9606 RepID=Q01344-5|nr:interleukin 5 receptor alpha transcript variant 8 [Homo sapiens]